VAHLSPDAPNVDVYVDGQLLSEARNLAYGTVSSYVPLRGGTHNVKMYRAGSSSRPLLEAALDLRDGVASASPTPSRPSA
jgi:hypothetical protein